jgi:multidrug efflux pump subunit AcrB
MVLGTGIGSEFRQGCGVGVVGGLLLSAILTVYLIPALYYRFSKNY